MLIKIEIQWSTWNIPWKFCVWSTMHARHKPLCLEEPIWLWIYLPNFKSNQNWLLCIQEHSIKKREPENSKLQSYWNHDNVSLIPLMMKEKHPPPLQLQRVSKTENRGIQKLTLHHSYLSKWQNSKSSEFLNISFTNTLCWLRYNQGKVLLFSLQSFLLQCNQMWQSSFGNQQQKKLLKTL